jgi:hypothetical protein
MAKDLTLSDIEQMTKDFADARNQMMAVGDALNVDMLAVREAHLPTLTAAAKAAQDMMTRLYDGVKANQHLFAIKGEKTKIFAGIKVGLQQGKAKVTAMDGGAVDGGALFERLIDLDRDDIAALIKIDYSPRAAALSALADDELAALKLARVAGSDTPIVKPVDEAAAKIVDALIKEFVADEQ